MAKKTSLSWASPGFGTTHVFRRRGRTWFMIHVYLVLFTYSVIYLFLTLGLAALDILRTPLRISNPLATTYGRPQDFMIAFFDSMIRV